MKSKYILLSTVIFCTSIITYYYKVQSASISRQPQSVLSSQMEKDLNTPRENTIQAEVSLKYFRLEILGKEKSRHLFDKAYKMFSSSSQNFAMARFVSLYPIVTTNDNFSDLMSWTYSDLKNNSAAVFAEIQKQQDEIFNDQEMHLAVLNMVHQLNLTPQQKAAFYNSSLSLPISMNRKGFLDNGSAVFELSLIMSQQDHVSEQDILPTVKEIAKRVNRDSDLSEALRVRVANYYPNMSSLFER